MKYRFLVCCVVAVLGMACKKEEKVFDEQWHYIIEENKELKDFGYSRMWGEDLPQLNLQKRVKFLILDTEDTEPNLVGRYVFLRKYNHPYQHLQNPKNQNRKALYEITEVILENGLPISRTIREEDVFFISDEWKNGDKIPNVLFYVGKNMAFFNPLGLKADDKIKKAWKVATIDSRQESYPYYDMPNIIEIANKKDGKNAEIQATFHDR